MTVQLNAHFETMFLLHLCPWGEDDKNELIAEIDGLGIDGHEFYSRNYRLVENYYHTFEKSSVASPGATLMHEMESTPVIVCANVFQQNPDWLSEMDMISDDAAQAAVIEMLISEHGETGGDIITALDAMELNDREKWQLIVLHERAGQQLRLIASAVAENLPAYEKACVKIQNELNALLQHFEQHLAQPQKTELLHLPEQMNPNTVVIPTMAVPVSIILMEDVCFYGLLSYKLSAGGEALTKDELLMGAKALSEKKQVRNPPIP